MNKREAWPKWSPRLALLGLRLSRSPRPRCQIMAKPLTKHGQTIDQTWPNHGQIMVNVDGCGHVLSMWAIRRKRMESREFYQDTARSPSPLHMAFSQ